jgi:glycosyltransferase involved in cell wall biosynthesis
MKKQILIVYAKSTTEIFNRQSALGSYIHCLASILVKNGYGVRINDLDFDSMPEQRSASVVKMQHSGLKKIVPSFIKEYVKDKRMVGWINELFNKIDNGKSFDKVLEFYTYGSDIGYRLSQKYHKPFIMVYDGPVLEEYSFFHPGQLFFKKKIEKRERLSILQSQSIVVYSTAVKKHLEKKLDCSLPCFIHQNVDFTRFEFIKEKPSAGPVNIGFIGSFLKWHRVDLLLNVFRRLREDGKNIKLFLLGDGMEFNVISDLVSKNKYRADIEMPGYIDGEQLFDYKKKLHVGVMPGSNWYGAPNKIFEYGAAGMAVVAPDTATIKDLFEDKMELLLFKQDDETDLFEKLKVYIDNIEILNRNASLLQLKIQRNYSENITFEFYNDLMQKNR